MSFSDTLTFLAAGDLHTGGNDPERIRPVFEGAKRHPDAAFLAVPGDITDGGQPAQYEALQTFYSGLPYPFLGVMGNHDVHTGPDEEARMRFCAAMGVETATYVRRLGPATFVFLSTDGNIDGCSVDIGRSHDLLRQTLAESNGPVIAFCHAPLTGTVGGVKGRACFLSDDPGFGLLSSRETRAIIRDAGKPVVWICGHTHAPLQAERLIYTEKAGRAFLHSVNVSCPYFTGRDFVQTEPIVLYVCTVTTDALDVVIEDAQTGAVLRRERLRLR